jgi:hypothetical protein
LSGRATASNRTAPLEPKVSIQRLKLESLKCRSVHILKVPKCTYDKGNVI